MVSNQLDFARPLEGFSLPRNADVSVLPQLATGTSEIQFHVKNREIFGSSRDGSGRQGVTCV